MPPKNNYLRLLDDAWRAHIAKRVRNAPTVLSTFAGCGGSSLGYSMAGYRKVLAVEWNNNAVDTFNLNFPDVPVYRGDITKLSVEQSMEMAGIGEGELDVFDGSPPCQGFSTAGKRIMGDSRNDLFRVYVRLLRGLKPKVFVMENVSGMVKGKMKIIFAEAIRELKTSGYRVGARLLNTMYFNVPQSRERIILIGTRDNLGIDPSYPPAQTIPYTVRQAIGHIPPGNPGDHSPQVISAWQGSLPNQSLRKVNRYVGSFQSVRLNPDSPSPTQIKSHWNWHWAIPRYLTAAEASLLHSFPEGWLWAGGRSNIKERIGNSVPPLFIREIASHIRRGILNCEPKQKAKKASTRRKVKA